MSHLVPLLEFNHKEIFRQHSTEWNHLSNGRKKRKRGTLAAALRCYNTPMAVPDYIGICVCRFGAYNDPRMPLMHEIRAEGIDL
jgi:hypothetical protein